jgi:SAM-dependent methyltransferase
LGASGRVVAVDVQPRMVNVLKRRLAKAGLAERADVRLVEPGSMGLADLAGSVEFVLAFAMVHELPAVDVFFQEVSQAMKPGACMLLAEPAGHVTAAEFAAELAGAGKAGLKPGSGQ